MRETLSFGHFEIHTPQRELIVEGQPVPIGARAFDLLQALAERRERVVPRGELLDIVWPGLIVEENNLAVHISALRKILGPRAIATIPGRGYRLIAPLAGDSPPREAPLQEAALAASSPAKLVLSAPAIELLGRTDELNCLPTLLERARCVTVVGTGGIGKTALARGAAHQSQQMYPNGAAWVDLAEIVDPSLIPTAIAQALLLDPGSAPDPLPALIGALKPLRMILVLDGAEHLLPQVSKVVSTALQEAPNVRLLTTSQAPMKIEGEQVFRLGPLSVPDDDADVNRALDHGAVALFSERAHAADQRFALTGGNVAAVITLCRQLDGLPLAIKLAAARLPLFGLRGLIDRLGDRLHLLRHLQHQGPARQQTLLAALDWSHGALDEAQQAVFRRLSVFCGGFPLDMVGHVACGAALKEWAVIDALEELVNRSLVDVDERDLPRYRLPETTRAYARLRLEGAAEVAATQQRHAEATADRMEEAYEAYWFMADGPWLARYSFDLDNVRAAVDWATPNQPQLAMRLVANAGVLFMLLGQASEARRRFKALDAVAESAVPSSASARYWLERSRLHWGVANDVMRALAEKATNQYRALDDPRGIVLSLRCQIGNGLMRGPDADEALTEMLALQAPGWPPRLRAQCLLAKASVLRSSGRIDESCTVSRALLELAECAGLDAMTGVALAELAGARLALGDAEGALSLSTRLIDDPRARRGNFVLHGLGTILGAYLVKGDLQLARQALVGFVTASRSRDWEWFGLYASLFALLASCEGRLEDAARLLGYSGRVALEVGPALSHLTQARERARAAVESALDHAAVARCALEGTLLDEASACQIALADPAS